MSLLFSFACKKEGNEAGSFSSEESSKISTHADLAASMKAIEPFFKPMGDPQPDEWLAHFKEEGQTFEQYINSNPSIPTPERKTIYIQPLGKFSAEQLKAIGIASGYMGSFFQLPVKLLKEKKFEEPFSLEDYRINIFSKNRQIRTGYVMDDVLLPNLPDDAAAMIAFTNEDLYPDQNFNYVFGQAYLQKRVGVWSLYRLREDADFKKFLKRTMKVAVHETGHMFSIAHCTKYECVMSGTNHLIETDKRPIDACPECMAKICWMNKSAPQKRYLELAGLCKKDGLEKDAKEFEEKAEALD